MGATATPISRRARRLRLVVAYLAAALVCVGLSGYGLWRWHLRTSAWFAARRGDVPALTHYLDMGVAPDSASWQGLPALGIAAYQGHEGVVRVLLQHGADPTPALAQAVLMRRRSVVSILLAAGADPCTRQPGYLRSPLESARECGDAVIVRLLEQRCGRGTPVPPGGSRRR